VFKKVGFQHREGWMKQGTEERSVHLVREHQKARLNSRFDAEWLPDSLRVRYRIYSLSAELMKFYIARKPTIESRSLILDWPRLVFLSKESFLNNLFKLIID
jgi:hypothetical protein